MKTERPSRQRIAPADTAHRESFKSQKLQRNKSFKLLKVQWFLVWQAAIEQDTESIAALLVANRKASKQITP
jgi:hypothetical protein